MYGGKHISAEEQVRTGIFLQVLSRAENNSSAFIEAFFSFLFTMKTYTLLMFVPSSIPILRLYSLLEKEVAFQHMPLNCIAINKNMCCPGCSSSVKTCK